MNPSIVLAIHNLQCWLQDHIGGNVDLSEVTTLLQGIKGDLENGEDGSAAMILSSIRDILSDISTGTSTGSTNITTALSGLQTTLTSILAANTTGDSYLATLPNINSSTSVLASSGGGRFLPRGFTVAGSAGDTIQALIAANTVTSGSSPGGYNIRNLKIYNNDVVALSMRLGESTNTPLSLPAGQMFNWGQGSFQYSSSNSTSPGSNILITLLGSYNITVVFDKFSG